MIRHYNMHKKRDNSLQHGFMRFSPLDDCSVYYHGCHLNGKSTHYHCMQVPAPPLPRLPRVPHPQPTPLLEAGLPLGQGPLLTRNLPFYHPRVPEQGWQASGESWGLRLQQRLVGQGGAFLMAILGVGEIQ